MDRDEIFKALGEAAEELAKLPSHQVCVGCGKKRPYGLVVSCSGEDYGSVTIELSIALKDGDDQRHWCNWGGQCDNPGDHCPDCDAKRR